MHKTLANFTGVLASVSILAGGAHPDPRHDERRGDGGRESSERGGGERGGGERGGGQGFGERLAPPLGFRGGGAPQGYGERLAPPPAYRAAPVPAYAGSTRYRGVEDRYPQGGYPGDYRSQPSAPAYPEGYAPTRRPNSLGSGWREQQEEARSGVRQGQMAPLGNVIQGIGRRSPGRSLDAGIEYEGGRAVYRVRWLMSNGRRVDYIVDAATGRIISEH